MHSLEYTPIRRLEWVQFPYDPRRLIVGTSNRIRERAKCIGRVSKEFIPQVTRIGADDRLGDDVYHFLNEGADYFLGTDGLWPEMSPLELEGQLNGYQKRHQPSITCISDRFLLSPEPLTLICQLGNIGHWA